MDVSDWEWNEIGSKALFGATTGLAYGLGGVAGGMIKGTFAAIKGLSMAQSIGVLIGTAAITGFGAGIGVYAMQNVGTGNDFNLTEGLSWGFGQLGSSGLSFFTGGMMVGSGLWNVGKNAINPYDPISRGFAKTLVNLPLNNFFEGFRW